MLRLYEASAVCGILAGPVLLAASWAGALAQPDGFSIIHHASSDLGADTADGAWVSTRLGSNLSGLLLLVFAIGLWRTLGRHRSARIGAFLVGAVAVGLFLTGFITLDCREIDVNCDTPMSWQATGHVIVAVATALALFVSPFVIARGLRFAASWRDLRGPTLVFAVTTIAGAIIGSVVGEGFGQYVAVIVWFAWITILAVRMRGLARAAPEPTPAEPQLNQP
jgi:hypothetical membrane protein